MSEPFDRSGLFAVRAFEKELVLITAKGARRYSTIAGFHGRTLIAFPPGCAHRRRVLDWLAGAGTSVCSILDVDSRASVVALAAAGTGVAVVPVQMCKKGSRKAAQSTNDHGLPAFAPAGHSWFGQGRPAPPYAASLNCCVDRRSQDDEAPTMGDEPASSGRRLTQSSGY